MKSLNLRNNNITSRGLHYLTPLLRQRQESSSLSTTTEEIDLSDNGGLCDDEHETRLFFAALGQSTTAKKLRLSCRAQSHAYIALFEALATDTCSLTSLHAFGAFSEAALHGDGLASLIDNLPKMRRLERLGLCVDFANPRLLSALHKNTFAPLE